MTPTLTSQTRSASTRSSRPPPRRCEWSTCASPCGTRRVDAPPRESKSTSFALSRSAGTTTTACQHTTWGPLAWSHRDPLQSRLGPGATSSAALGYGFTGENDPRFFIDLGVPWPNSRVNILGLGTYRFTLRITAANADAEEWTVTLANEADVLPDGSPDHKLSITDGPRRLRAVEARRETRRINSAEQRALPKPNE
jgi:hypothetical protein